MTKLRLLLFSFACLALVGCPAGDDDDSGQPADDDTAGDDDDSVGPDDDDSAAGDDDTTGGSETKAGLECTLLVEPDGSRHLGYVDDLLNGYQYATDSTGEWERVQLDDADPLYLSCGVDSAMVQAHDGAIHTVYVDECGWDGSIGADVNLLKYASNSSGDWVVEEFPLDIWEAQTVAYRVSEPSLGLDGQGAAHVWLDSGSTGFGTTHLHHATREPGQGLWTSASVDLGAALGGTWYLGGVRFAIDDSGTSHGLVSYLGDAGFPPVLYLATDGSGELEFSVIEMADIGYTPWSGDLVLDDQGFRHAAWMFQGDGDLRLRYYTDQSGNWVMEDVDTWPGELMEEVSLAIDGSGAIHVSYWVAEEGAVDGILRYATNASGAWITTDLDTDPDAGRYNSIGLDGDGHVHVAYYTQTCSGFVCGRLMMATNASGSWATELVAPLE